VLLTGCAWTGQQVDLSPNIESKRGPVVNDRRVLIRVDDERPSRIFGHKAPAGGGEITPVQDPVVVVHDAFARGLTQLGFVPTESAEDAAQLEIELRAIDYKVMQGFWSGGLYVDVVLKAICRFGPMIRYDEVFKGHHEERVQIAQSKSSNEAFINDALSQAINAALWDEQLIQCLASDA
jgi:hypothetical protein